MFMATRPRYQPVARQFELTATLSYGTMSRVRTRDLVCGGRPYRLCFTAGAFRDFPMLPLWIDHKPPAIGTATLREASDALHITMRLDESDDRHAQIVNDEKQGLVTGISPAFTIGVGYRLSRDPSGLEVLTCFWLGDAWEISLICRPDLPCFVSSVSVSPWRSL